MAEAMSEERLTEIRAYNDEYGVGGATDADSIVTDLLDEVQRLNTVLDANRVVRNAAESSSRTYKAVVDRLKAERTRLRAELDKCAGLNRELVNENEELAVVMAEAPTDEQLEQIRARSARLAAVPLETSVENRVMRDMIDSIGDVRWLLEQLTAATGRVEQAETITARVTDRMREYDRYGGGMVNIRQVLSLLSPTWPDGNYEAAPAGGDRD